MRVGTVASPSQWPAALVLSRGCLDADPGSVVTVLTLEPAADPRIPGLRVIGPSALGISAAEWRELRAFFHSTELVAVLGPRLLRWLLQEDPAPVVLLGTDTDVFAPLDGLPALVEDAGLAVCRRLAGPAPADGLQPSEDDVVAAGVLEPGFLAVGPRGTAWLEWVAVRGALRTPGTDPFRVAADPWSNAELLAGGAAVVSDAGVGASVWNLHERGFALDGDRFLVDGGPLRTFHFAGFWPSPPWITPAWERPRIVASEQPTLRELARRYRALLSEAVARSGDGGAGPGSGAGLRLPNGIVYDGYMHWAYRAAVAAACRGEEEEPPNPFAPASAEAFLLWLRRAADPNRLPLTVSRYLRGVWMQRADVRDAFSTPQTEDLERFVAWAASDEAFGREVPGLLRVAVPLAPRRTAADRRGVNVAGYLRAEVGIGEVARRLVTSLEAAGEPVALVPYGRTASRQEHPFADPRGEGSPFDVSIVAVNADHLPTFLRDAGDRLGGRHRVGLWFWETEDFPRQFHRSFDFVDEVWVGSEFVRAGLAGHTVKPVEVFPVPVPVPVPAPPSSGLTRADLGLPDGFLFLFCFDHLSGFERKNPLGLMEAFTAAFAPGDGAALVIKSINGGLRRRDRERLRLAALEHAHVVLVERYFSAAEVDGLMDAADCYVSLHRAEGFGLTLADAMARGKPVVATGYSGNLAFMTDENSFLVGYERSAVGHGQNPYLPWTRWAEPDPAESRELLQRIAGDPVAAAERGRRGQADVLARHSVDLSADFVRRRLAAIRARPYAGRG